MISKPYIGALLVALLATTAVAQQTKQERRREARRRDKERYIAQLLARYDKSEDGVLDESELPPFLKKYLPTLDTNRDRKLAKKELERMPGRLGQRAGEVITGPARGERFRDTLQIGDAAPDFTLADPTGKKEVKLSNFQGKRPVVLIFGSYT